MKKEAIDRRKLQDNIPKNIVDEIWKQAEYISHFETVYRVAKWGTIEEKVFWNTYREIQEGIIPDNDAKYPKEKEGTYSLSVYDKKDSCIKYINFLKKSVRLREAYPHPEIIQGKTSRGLVQRTIDRIEDYPDPTHIDWWIFHGAQMDVMNDFRLCE